MYQSPLQMTNRIARILMRIHLDEGESPICLQADFDDIPERLEEGEEVGLRGVGYEVARVDGGVGAGGVVLRVRTPRERERGRCSGREESTRAMRRRKRRTTRGQNGEKEKITSARHSAQHHDTTTHHHRPSSTSIPLLHPHRLLVLVLHRLFVLLLLHSHRLLLLLHASHR